MRILGYDYKLKWAPPQEEGGMDQAGRIWTGKLLMLVDRDGAQQMQESSVLHEAIEALNYHSEMTLSHQTMMSLEAGLYQFLRDCGMDTSLLLKELPK